MSKVVRKKEDEDVYVPTPEEEAELEESFAAVERGEWVDADEFLRELRKRLDNE